MSAYTENDKCSRCGIIGGHWWHVCQECNEKAQNKYRSECEALVK